MSNRRQRYTRQGIRSLAIETVRERITFVLNIIYKHKASQSKATYDSIYNHKRTTPLTQENNTINTSIYNHKVTENSCLKQRREERQPECWIVKEMNRGEVMNRGGSIDGAVERSIVEKSRDPFFRRTPERERRDQTLYCSNTCLLRRASPTL
ncbi:hypothetical protein YC2023_037498 [Brassica napus]